MGTRARVAIIVGVLSSVAATARADGAWYFAWHCAGACAADGMTASGVDGPYASEGECELAGNARAFDINREGSAGSVELCTTDGAGGSSSSGGVVHAATPARYQLSAQYGAPWAIAYQDGATARTSSTTGANLEAAFGRQVFGIFIGLGTTRTRLPPTTAPAATMWIVDLQVGLHSAPVALVKRPGLEVRPAFAVVGVDSFRTGCEVCDSVPNDVFGVPEPNQGLGVRLRGGVDVWLGHDRTAGFAIEAIYQALRMTGRDASADPHPELISELTAPRWLLQLSFIGRPRIAAR